MSLDLRVLNSAALSRLGRLRHVLFDIDGTLSTLRQGWEETMIPVMLDAIGGGKSLPPEIEVMVRAYVDRSTGILTIRQMEWLAEAVQRFGFIGPALTPVQYKAIYLQRLMVDVQQRIDHVARGAESADQYLIAGSRAFIQRLVEVGLTLYLASGTDHTDVVHEAEVLGIYPCFKGGAYGALDASEINDKGQIITRILSEHRLSGAELLVVGDGPLEIHEGRRHGAITLGMATDEIARSGWNLRKGERLSQAGSDFLIPDFSQTDELLRFFFII